MQRFRIKNCSEPGRRLKDKRWSHSPKTLAVTNSHWLAAWQEGWAVDIAHFKLHIKDSIIECLLWEHTGSNSPNVYDHTLCENIECIAEILHMQMIGISHADKNLQTPCPFPLLPVWSQCKKWIRIAKDSVCHRKAHECIDNCNKLCELIYGSWFMSISIPTF